MSTHTASAWPAPRRGVRLHRLVSHRLATLWSTCCAWIARRRRGVDPQAGDVPGWVMVTLMSALIVAGIYAVAGPALLNLFNDAIKNIKGM